MPDRADRVSGTRGTRDVVCPFFRLHGDREIRCEGIMEDTVTALLFRSPQTKRFFLRTYCAGRCKACEIYRMLMDNKYTDD